MIINILIITLLGICGPSVKTPVCPDHVQRSGRPTAITIAITVTISISISTQYLVFVLVLPITTITITTYYYYYHCRRAKNSASLAAPRSTDLSRDYHTVGGKYSSIECYKHKHVRTRSSYQVQPLQQIINTLLPLLHDDTYH